MKKKLAFVVATPVTFDAFLSGHAAALQDEYDISVIANFDGYTGRRDWPGIKTIHVPIQRKISVFADLKALILLASVFRRPGFDVVQSVTPKAGLLAGVAGVFSGIRNRVHMFTGQVWATKTGVSRWILKTCDKITMRCCTSTLADSRSQADFLRFEGFSKPLTVLGDGSIAGIDIDRFHPSDTHKIDIRQQHGFGPDDCVFIFLGRLNRDKGVLDLVEGFTLAALGPTFRLLIVGPDEEGIADIITQNSLAQSRQIVLTGGTNTPEQLLAAADVLCLPSYREGFGNSVLEGAAVGLPAITSRIYGLTDAVVEGETGIMHQPGAVLEIAACLRKMGTDAELRTQFGEAARDRVRKLFAPHRIETEIRHYYAKLLGGL